MTDPENNEFNPESKAKAKSTITNINGRHFIYDMDESSHKSSRIRYVKAGT